MGKKNDTGGFPKKLYKLLGPGVAEEMNAMSARQLEAAMVAAEEAIDESERAMGEDPDVADLKAKLAAAREPYTAVIKAQRAKIKYALHCRAQEV